MHRRNFIAKLPAALAVSTTFGAPSTASAQSCDPCSFQAQGDGAIQRTTEDKLREWISVLDFIPLAQHAAIFAGTSTYDCTADFQRAITAAIGKALRIPGGRYRVGSTITIALGPIEIVGDGENCTTIETSNSTASIIDIACGTNILGYIRIRNLTLDAAAQKTGGFGISVSAASGGTFYFGDFRNIILTERMFAGIQVQSSFFLTLSDITVGKIAENQSGFLFRGVDGISKNVNSWVTRCRVLNGSPSFVTTGFLYDSHCEGLYMSDCTFESTGLNYSLKIDNSLAAPSPPQHLWLTRVICDNPTDHGFIIVDARTLRMTDCWAASAQRGYGMWLLAGVDIEIRGASCIANSEDGLRVDSACHQVRVIGGMFDANGQIASNTRSGIIINSNTDDFQIVGANFYRTGTTKSQKHSIQVLGGTSNRYIIANNNLYGYVTSDMSNGATGSNKIVGPNLN